MGQERCGLGKSQKGVGGESFWLVRRILVLRNQVVAISGTGRDRGQAQKEGLAGVSQCLHGPRHSGGSSGPGTLQMDPVPASTGGV